jgi:hypothetical protein
MNCDTVREKLDDYVDGGLPEGQFQEIELHLEGCAACRAEEGLLRSLLSQAAALPREMTPPHDLWGGIADRMAQKPKGNWSLKGFFLSPLVLAAASVLIAVVATRYTPPGMKPAAPQGHVQEVATTDPSLVQAEQQYRRAAGALKATLDAKRTTLSPETQKAVDNDLKVIDDALQSLRVALQKDPGNTELAQLLIATHRRKLDVLQKVTRLADAL